MATYKELFMQYMDANDVRYTEQNERVIKVVYSGENLKSIPIIVFFTEDNQPLVEFKCWEIARFLGKEDKALIACNDVNSEYRWVKFYLDKDSDIVAQADAIVSAESCGAECMQMVRRMVNIIDGAYPTFGKALWA